MFGRPPHGERGLRYVKAQEPSQGLGVRDPGPGNGFPNSSSNWEMI